MCILAKSQTQLRLSPNFGLFWLYIIFDIIKKETAQIFALISDYFYRIPRYGTIGPKYINIFPLKVISTYVPPIVYKTFHFIALLPLLNVRIKFFSNIIDVNIAYYFNFKLLDKPNTLKYNYMGNPWWASV